MALVKMDLLALQLSVDGPAAADQVDFTLELKRFELNNFDPMPLTPF